MRITIEAADETADLMRARKLFDVLIADCAPVPQVDMGASIETLGLSLRSRNALANGEVQTIAELCACSRFDLMRLRNLGTLSLHEIEAALVARGLSLRQGA